VDAAYVGDGRFEPQLSVLDLPLNGGADARRYLPAG
jgi:hypothetical protein